MSFFSAVIQHLKNNGNNALGIDLAPYSKTIFDLCHNVYEMANGTLEYTVDGEEAYFQVFSKSSHDLYMGKDRYRTTFEFAMSDLIWAKIAFDGTTTKFKREHSSLTTVAYELDKFSHCDLRSWHQATQEAVEHHLVVALFQVSENA